MYNDFWGSVTDFRLNLHPSVPITIGGWKFPELANSSGWLLDLITTWRHNMARISAIKDFRTQCKMFAVYSLLFVVFLNLFRSMQLLIIVIQTAWKKCMVCVAFCKGFIFGLPFYRFTHIQGAIIEAHGITILGSVNHTSPFLQKRYYSDTMRSVIRKCPKTL